MHEYAVFLGFLRGKSSKKLYVVYSFLWQTQFFVVFCAEKQKMGIDTGGAPCYNSNILLLNVRCNMAYIACVINIAIVGAILGLISLVVAKDQNSAESCARFYKTAAVL